jgi:hypothetical protein
MGGQPRVAEPGFSLELYNESGATPVTTVANSPLFHGIHS